MSALGHQMALVSPLEILPDLWYMFIERETTIMLMKCERERNKIISASLRRKVTR